MVITKRGTDVNGGFKVGEIVVNLNAQVARIVGIFVERSRPHPHNGEPVLQAIGADGKARGGRWVASSALCRLATSDEVIERRVRA